MPLKQSAASGIKWTLSAHVVRQIAQVVTTSILAHLLSPDDFGLVAMAMVVVGFAMLFNDLGTSSSIIQKQDASKKLLSSVFWVSIAFGVLVAVICVLTAPLIASAYNDSRLTEVIQGLSLLFVISGLGVLQRAQLQKALQFRKLSKIEMIGTLTGAACGITGAMMGLGVWSLVLQALVTESVMTVLLWVANPWLPQLSLSLTELKSIGSYSLHLTGANVLNYVARNLDNLLIGMYLGAEALGYYALAYRLMLYPLQHVSAAFSKVMFPVYSAVQNDNAQFRAIYLKISAAIAFVTFPMMAGLWAVARPLILTIYGEGWEQTIILVMILCPVGMAQSIGTTVGSIYTAKGRTDWMFRWRVATITLVLVAFVIGLRWGVVGVATAYLIVASLLTAPSLAIPLRLINLPLRDLGNRLRLPLLCSLTMLLAVVGLGSILPEALSNATTLIILALTGALTYGGITWTINRAQLCDLISAVRMKDHSTDRS